MLDYIAWQQKCVPAEHSPTSATSNWKENETRFAVGPKSYSLEMAKLSEVSARRPANRLA